MSFDTLSGGRRKILMASESGLLAAVNAASGKIGESSIIDSRHTMHATHMILVAILVEPGVNCAWYIDYIY